MTPLRSSNPKFYEKDLLTVAGEKDILTPEETARYLRKSLSWVYKNAELLGVNRLSKLTHPEQAPKIAGHNQQRGPARRCLQWRRYVKRDALLKFNYLF